MERLARIAARWGAPLLAALVATAAGAAPVSFWTRVLRTDPVTDSHPRISGHSVVWQHGTGGAAEIFFRDDQHIFPLTQDGFADELPEIDGDTVVWQHDDGSDYEVMRYDGVSNVFITNNTTADNCPVASGGSIGWRGTGILSREFFLLPFTPQQITGDALDDECPRGADGNFVWTKFDGSARNVWAWFPAIGVPPDHLFQITTAGTESSPVISGNRIAYVEGTGSAAEIRLFDASDFSDHPLTSDLSEDRNPQIDGTRVVWEHFDGTDWEIYEYEVGGMVTPLTNNAVADHDPQVSGDSVVWVEDEPGHSQIWASWHGALPPQRVTHDARDHADPHIDGELITFQACDSTRCDIWLAPEPSAGALAMAALAALAAFARRR